MQKLKLNLIFFRLSQSPPSTMVMLRHLNRTFANISLKVHFIGVKNIVCWWNALSYFFLSSC